MKKILLFGAVLLVAAGCASTPDAAPAAREPQAEITAPAPKSAVRGCPGCMQEGKVCDECLNGKCAECAKTGKVCAKCAGNTQPL